MKFFALIISIILLSFNTHAADVKAQLDLSASQNVFKEGELLSGSLKIWPLENADLEEFKHLQNKQLTSSLQILGIDSVELSANNAEVVEAKLLLVVKKSPDYNSAINYHGTVIPIIAPDVKVAEGQIPKDYIILDQSLISSKALLLILAALLVASIALAIWKKEALMNLVKKFKSDPRAELIKKYRQLFESANSREDFEQLYASRRQWYELLNIKAQAYDEFFSVINEHQYKKDWSDKELNEVKKIFDIIRGSFK